MRDPAPALVRLVMKITGAPLEVVLHILKGAGELAGFRRLRIATRTPGDPPDFLHYMKLWILPQNIYRRFLFREWHENDDGIEF